MRKILFVPIEPIEERYSEQWLKWFLDAFDKHDIPVYTVGRLEKCQIKNGRFLDSIETIKYKQEQTQELVGILTANPKEQYTIFFMDLWHTAVPSIAYLRDMAGIDIKIKGIMHAGAYDQWDMVAEKCKKRWANSFERSLLRISDTIYVGSEFNKTLLCISYGNIKKIKVVKFPVKVFTKRVYKENIVVFPHRLDKEKDPDYFQTVEFVFRNKYPDINVRFIKAKETCKTKEEYYDLLLRAKVSFSSARQETFGIAMQESVNAGCFPVVPDRLSYVEQFDRTYNTLQEAADLIKEGLLYPSQIVGKHDESVDWVTDI